MSKLLAVAAMAMSVAFTGQAFAVTPGAPPQEVVKGQVDFQDSAAVEALYAKLRRAAAAVCDSNSANPRVTQADALCTRQALTDVVRRVDRPILTATHDRAYSQGDVQFATRR